MMIEMFYIYAVQYHGMWPLILLSTWNVASAWKTEFCQHLILLNLNVNSHMWLTLPYWQHSSIKQQSKVDMSLKCDLQCVLEIECVIANLKPKQEELRVTCAITDLSATRASTTFSNWKPRHIVGVWQEI